MDPVQKAILYCYQAQVNDAVRYLGQAVKFTGKCKVHCLLRHCQLMMQLMKLSTLGIFRQSFIMMIISKTKFQLLYRCVFDVVMHSNRQTGP